MPVVPVPSELVRRFADLTGSPTAGAALLARYGEEHRRYHTAEHLAEVLDWVDTLADLAEDPVAVELAAWYHDAIYDATAGAGESERRSAELAVVELRGLAQPESTIAEVERLVLLTAGHEPEPGDADGAVLADADLAILGADAQRYARYAAAVRAEYAHVPDESWFAGRAAVVRHFAERTRLYATDRAHSRLDAAARRNLRWELDTLRPTHPSG